MPDIDFDEFTWFRPADRACGFRWVGEREARRLSDLPREDLWPYRPGTALFKTFANLGVATEAEVLRFANRYGRLGQAGGVLDFLDAWWAHAREMGRLVALADALTGGSEKALRTALGDITPADRRAVAENRPATGARGGLAAGDYAHAAVARVFGAVLGGSGVLSGLSLRSRRDPRTGGVRVTIAYDSLWAFLLTQYALSLPTGRQFRQCAVCPTWFQLTPRREHGRRGRDDRQTCSDSCRVRLSRLRRQAVGLRAAGRAWGQVAARLGFDVVTVKKWFVEREE
jgi:hypothetical protein